MIAGWVEQKARELCEASGLNSDGLGYRDILSVPLWHAYVPLAYEVLRADIAVND